MVTDKAARILDKMSRRGGKKPWTLFPSPETSDQSTLGDKDKTFEWLNRAYQERDRLIADLKVNPLRDDDRSDPRFIALMKRIGLGDDLALQHDHVRNITGPRQAGYAKNA